MSEPSPIDDAAPPLTSATATIARRDPTRLRADEALTMASDFEQRYRLGPELARGGLATIRDAWDLVLHRRVAVKQLLERSADGDVRFLREARITGRLVHPNIVPIYDLGLDGDGAPFYAMKWVLGRSLHELIETRPALDDRLALVPHVIAITDALAYAHAAGVVHRDLKPANVLVGDYGETIVIDWGLALEQDTAVRAAAAIEVDHDEDGAATTTGFDPAQTARFDPGGTAGFDPGATAGFDPGATAGFDPGGTAGFDPGGTAGFDPTATHRDPAPGDVDGAGDPQVARAPDPASDPRLTSDGSVIGTPAYMPPEQARGEPVDARADVYALGALLYHVIAGLHPYADETGDGASFEPVWAHVIDHAPRPLAELAIEAPYELIAIVERAMARDPAARFPSAGALGAALAAFLTHHESHRLAHAAMRRDGELARRMASVDPGDAAAVAAVYREADVVRFGFDQALQGWADNPVARSGLARFCARMFDFEVAAGNLAGAAALASELPPDPERARLLAALEGARARRDADIDALAHARDRSVGGRERLIVLLVLVAMLGFFLIDAFAARRSLADPGAPHRILWSSIVVSAPVLALMALWRRRLFANEFSRRSARVLLFALGATMSHRGIAIVIDQPARHTFTLDFLLIAVALAGFGGRGGYVLGGVALAGAWACAVFVDQSVLIYNGLLIGFVGFLAWSWTGRARS